MDGSRLISNTVTPTTSRVRSLMNSGRSFRWAFRGVRCSPGPIKKKTVIGLGRLTWSLPIRFCGFGRTDCCGWCSAMGGSGLVAGWIRRIPDIECVAQGFSGDPRIGKIRNSPFRPACGQPAAQLHEPCHRPLVLKTVTGMRTNIMGTMLTDRRPESSRRPEKAVRNF